MPLNRNQKAAIIEEMSERFEESSIVYLTNFSGLTVAQSNELRGRFRDADVDYKVCKNTLAHMALDRVGGLDVLKEHLHGPTAIAFSDDPSAPARIIKDFLEEEDIERPKLKAAYIEGELYEGHEALEALSKLKSREELIADIVGLLLAPAQNITGSLTSAGQTLAGAIKTMADKEEE